MSIPVALMPATVITAAGTVTSSVLDLKANGQKLPLNLLAFLKVVYGSGGTSINVYVQTSINGADWEDVISFTQVTTASSKQVANINRQTKVAPAATTDGSLAAGSANDGVFGTLWRVKVVSVGTYAGNTTVEVDIVGEN